MVHRRARASVLALAGLTVGLLSIAAAVLFAELRTPERWDPLGEYPTQHVTSRVPGVPGPAARLYGDTVDVKAVKCGAEAESTEVLTTLVWKSVDPRGATWPRGQSFATREAGCTSLAFYNPVPPEVRALAEEQVEAGAAAPLWQITGTETPVRDGEEGVPRRWVTESFRLVP